MAFEIEFSENAERQLGALSARDRVTLLDEIEEQLSDTPDVETRRRKRLRTNPLAAWELWVGDFRVFYEVSTVQVLVIVIAVGIKRHNVLLIDGKEFLL